MPARRAVSLLSRRTLVPSAGAPSLPTSAAGLPPRSGWQIGQTDSGKPCSAHQSPLALKTGMSLGLHLVQIASSTPCSSHMAPSTALAAALGAPGADESPHATPPAATSTATAQTARLRMGHSALGGRTIFRSGLH